jgi:CHAT domain-containing protein
MKISLDYSRLALKLVFVFCINNLSPVGSGYVLAANAREADSLSVMAVDLNDQGNLLASQEKYGEAITAYEKSFNLAKQAGNPTLSTKALINAAEISLQKEDHRKGGTFLELAWKQVQGLNDSRDKAYLLIALGQVSRRIDLPASKGAWRQIAYQAFSKAADIAEVCGDLRAASYALGYLGQLYEEEKRSDEALYLTQRAAFAAQQVKAPEILYQWHWQTGRLLKVQGDRDGAISAYERAVHSLQSVRPDVAITYRSLHLPFRETAGKVFLELADLRLKRAASLQDQSIIQEDLKKTQETIEKLKSAELQDYFQDDCVIALKQKEISLKDFSQGVSHTAAVYPVILPDRLELLLNLPDGRIKRFAVMVSNDELETGVRAFRGGLQNFREGYRPHAKNLYDWLIRPIEAELVTQKIDTLVFIPDEPLRTIPMAALSDGEKFLIEKYAVATTPGLTLTDPQPIKRENVQLLSGGLTESAQGFIALPKVSDELKDIQEIYGGKRLQDEEFVIGRLKQELTNVPYTIVHMATHGKFESDVRQSFLVAYDGKITMNDLERFIGLSQYRQRPVELLSLSACETAVGDDRAALGLAGIAIKVGARSALATLWSVSDEAAALLIPEFYRQLEEDPSLSKAKALQNAQLKLLEHDRYKYPGFWAPFLLIGNWL